MTKEIKQKKDDVLVKSIEKKYGVSLSYSTDAKLYKSLRDSGVPSLSKLLKMTQKKST